MAVTHSEIKIELSNIAHFEGGYPPKNVKRN